MSLLFVHFCDLLEDLEAIKSHDPPYLPAEQRRSTLQAIRIWISSHGSKVKPEILLSALFPAKRTDRVYSVQTKRLSRQIGRSLSIGHERFKEINRYHLPGHGDLGQCVERVQRQTEFQPPPASKALTLQQVEHAFDQLASRSTFSSKDIRAGSLDVEENVMTVDALYKSIQSREMKWLTRLLLKDLSSIDLHSHANPIYQCVDPRLPSAMQMHDNFFEAVQALSTTERLETKNLDSCVSLYEDMRFSPQVGVKVGPAHWVKAQGGIDHALSMIRSQVMSVERKYDGEYCQIHIDLAKDDNAVQIFSKSGKDSTKDRMKVVPAILKGLRVGETNRGFSEKCILEGELLVWSDRDEAILEFHKLRKHIARSGLYIGTKEDSQPHKWEHLMLVFFDILLLDDDSVLHRPMDARQWLLKQVVKPIKGRIALAEQLNINFRTQPDGAHQLKRHLAQAFAKRWEGLVLKPASEPYFGLTKGLFGSRSPWIKLKKDCIPGYGDTADFAIVGAGYDAKRAQQFGLLDIRWTHFFLGCLKNKAAVAEGKASPSFLIVDCVTDCICREDLRMLSQMGGFSAASRHIGSNRAPLEFEMVYMDPRLPPRTCLFSKPFVFEIAGSGFERGPNRSIYTLRFPRVLKVRWDADWRECIDCDELRTMAERARTLPGVTLEEEISKWMTNLEQSSKALRCTTDAQQASSGSVEVMTAPHEEMVDGSTTDTHVRVDTNATSNREETAGCESRAGPPSEDLSESKIPITSLTEDHENNGDSIAAPSGKRKRPFINANTGTTPSFSAGWPSRRSEPLREIGHLRNSGQRHEAGGLRTGVTVGESYLQLVRKHASGIEAPSRRPKRREIRYIRSSPDAATTTDDCSSAASTQIRTLYAVASQPCTRRSRINVGVGRLATPPPTAEVEKPMALPDVRSITVFMDNCKQPSDELRKFYQTHSMDLKGILRPICQLYNIKNQATLDPTKQVIFLVDGRQVTQAAQDLLDITACMLKIRRAISIWDWRVLRWLVQEDENSSPKKEAWKQLYVALMDIERKTGEVEEAHVTVEWQDGVTEHVPLRKAEELSKDLKRRSEKLNERMKRKSRSKRRPRKGPALTKA